MKKNILIVLMSVVMILACGTSGSGAELKWEGNLEQALEKAAAEGKVVLVNFTGSDWCGWCIKLKDEVFKKKEFIEYAKSDLILVELDFPRAVQQTEETKQYNAALMKEYEVRGFPTIILLSGDGEILLRTGYQPGGAASYVKHLRDAVK